MNVIVREIEYGSEDYREAIALRLRILREPLGLGLTPQQLAAEVSDTHVSAFCGNRIVGCLVLTPICKELVRMRQVSVDIEMQGQGIGAKMVRYAECLARERGFVEMDLHARQSVMGFYHELGYHAVGEPYIEVTLPHVTMQKTLV